MKKFIVGILFFVLIFGTYNPGAYAISVRNGLGNVLNDGYAVSDGEYVYYSADEKLYRENIGGGNRKTILDDGSCSHIVPYGDYIFFSKSNLMGGSLYKVKKNGQSDKENIAGCMPSPYTKIHKGYMYYITGDCKIRKRNMNNWDEYVDIGETYGNFVIDDNKIYFENEDSKLGAKGLASINLDGNEFKSFLVGNVSQIITIRDNMLYYISNDHINRLNIQSGNEEQLIESSYICANIYGDYIYFRNKNKKLTGLSLNGGVVQESEIDVYDTFCIVENKIYTRSPDSFKNVKVYDLPQFSGSNNQNENDSTTTTFGSPVSDWAKDEVEDAYEEGLIPDVLVGADLTKKVDRAEFAAIAVALYEKLSGNTATKASNPFSDISGNKCKDEILKAYNLNITIGTSANTFSPDENISREQVATMLTRTYKKSEFKDWTIENDDDFVLNCMGVRKFDDDDQISDYAKESVYFMYKWEIINGVGDNKFAPKNSVTLGESYGYATREQAVIIALRSAKHL